MSDAIGIPDDNPSNHSNKTLQTALVKAGLYTSRNCPKVRTELLAAYKKLTSMQHKRLKLSVLNEVRTANAIISADNPSGTSNPNCGDVAKRERNGGDFGGEGRAGCDHSTGGRNVPEFSTQKLLVGLRGKGYGRGECLGGKDIIRYG